MKKSLFNLHVLFVIIAWLGVNCKEKNHTPSKATIAEMALKKGEVISCSPNDKQFGSVVFENTCSEEVKEDFNLATKLLHSFEYDEAEKVFSKMIDKQPECAMAYWGVAMANFHPLWTPPTEAELKKGAKAIEIAQQLPQKSKEEASYINAISILYKDWNKVDHHARCVNYSQAMEKIYKAFPNDKEAAIFYALALTAAADPADKSYTNQKKAGSILNALYAEKPNHPGILHYIIHTYDYPELAKLALPAARKYALVAPSSAHALHMPSHIFTRLGLWNECIHSNLASVSSARCYAQSAGIKGHWDEELHGMDYLVYAYLQKGQNKLAKEQLDYLKTIKDVYPANFKVAYAFAAIPSRYVLENRLWREAANLNTTNTSFPWKQFQWQKAIIHFTRLLGSVHIGNLNAANAELRELNFIHNSLLAQKDTYKANQVQIQIKASEAWIRLKEAKDDEALALMNTAADMEDKTEKHPVTPGEVIPARELLGDMFLEMNNFDKALAAYEADLEVHPNRFNGLYGAGLAAEKSGNAEKAAYYYQRLLKISDTSKSNRAELSTISFYLKKHA